jgi:hypothetical protein
MFAEVNGWISVMVRTHPHTYMTVKGSLGAGRYMVSIEHIFWAHDAVMYWRMMFRKIIRLIILTFVPENAYFLGVVLSQTQFHLMSQVFDRRCLLLA